MTPRNQLVVSVIVIAAVIAVAWIMLFQRNVLTPPMTAPTGPTLPELGKEFDADLERFNKLLAPTNAAPANVLPSVPVAPVPPATSDDVRAPSP